MNNHHLILNGFCTTDPSECTKIVSDAGVQKELETIPELLERIAATYGSHTALVYQNETSKEWTEISYKEYRERVEKMAKVFIKLGLERHGTVAVLASNSVEWFVSELAAIHAGGIIAGVYTTNSVDSCLHILETSKANIVVVDDSEQLKKIWEIKDKLPHLKAVVQTLSTPSQNLSSSDGYWRWSELETMDTEDVEEEYKKRAAEIVPNECCCLIYTSGTTGKSKGVLLSHDNLLSGCHSIMDLLSDVQIAKEIVVSYLPLSHVAGQSSEIFMPMIVAGTVYFADKSALKGSLVSTLVVAKPTIFFSVPRVFEKIQEKISAIDAYNEHCPPQNNEACLLGSGSVQHKLADIFKKMLGLENCRYFHNGAAPIKIETKKFFMSLGMIIRDAYGLSESAGCHSLCTRESVSLETVGKSLMKAKILNPDEKGHGEICLKGRHVFMGYLNDVEKTLEAFDDEGWLRTGDIGYLDEEGYLFITGRIKELIITAGGENIPPIIIEEAVKRECPAISNAFLVGDKRKFLTILVTLKTEMNSDGAPCDELSSETLKWLEEMDLKYTKLSEILAAGPDEKVLQTIQEAINRANRSSISNAQKVQKFSILPNDFSISTGELGPTMKLKRNVVVEKYNDVIEGFYK